MIVPPRFVPPPRTVTAIVGQRTPPPPRRVGVCAQEKLQAKARLTFLDEDNDEVDLGHPRPGRQPPPHAPSPGGGEGGHG